MKKQRYGISSLRKQFPDEFSCLEFIFDTLYERGCSCGGSCTQISGRRQFQCSKCRFQIAPASQTIFHKSNTPLLLWFHAILAFSNAKGSISAKQLERDLEVSYKCAWRILRLIRRAFDEFPYIHRQNPGFANVLRELIKFKSPNFPRYRRRRMPVKNLVRA